VQPKARLAARAAELGSGRQKSRSGALIDAEEVREMRF
jgi:hypothetical protein